MLGRKHFFGIGETVTSTGIGAWTAISQRPKQCSAGSASGRV